MDRRRLPLAVGLLLLAAAYALPLPDAPVGEEATQLLAAASLWHDGDLRYEAADLARGYAAWEVGPRRLALIPGTRPGVGTFAAPVPYVAVAAPAYGLLGARGLRLLNVALLLAMLWLARRHLLGPAEPRPHPAGLLLAGFFLASAVTAWTLRFQSEIFLTACLFFSVAIWCQVRSEPGSSRWALLPWAGSGALLAVAAVSEPALALLALPVVVDLAWARRFRGAAVFATALLGVALLVAGVQERLTGAWGPALAAEAHVYDGPYPLEAVPALETGGSGGARSEETAAPSPRLLLRRAGWLLAGRHVGLLPYFPFALFVVGLYLVDLRRGGGRARHLLAVTLLVYLGLAVARFPWAASGDAASLAAPGARALALVYPLFLLLPRRFRAGRAAILPALAAGVWVVPSLAVAAGGLAGTYGVELPARGPTFRPLPVELELLAEGSLPGYTVFDRFPEATGGRWLVPLETFFLAEGHPEGVWVHGSSRSEVFVVSAGPLDAIRFRASSVAAENVLRVTGDGEVLRARYDTAGKRQGVPVEVRPELVARGLGLFLEDEPEAEHVYRFVLETSGGAIPARVNPESDDPRYLGVFLEF